MRCLRVYRLGLILPAIALTAAGCKVRATMPRSDADALRERIVELEREVIDLERQSAELEAALAGSGDGVPDDVLFATPHVAAIEIERLSHFRARPGADPVLLVYVRPTDGYGRFVQLVGSLSINAAILPPDAGAFSIGRVALDPVEVRDAYRSSLMGTHYTIEVSLDPAVAAGYAQCIVQAEFVDGRSGRKYTADMAVAME